MSNYSDMWAHCDQLTENDKRLSITWDGGSDSGEFSMRLDGNAIIELSPLEDEILEFVAAKVGYGGFDGDFSTSGEVEYNRANKCFIGQEAYSENEGGLRKCDIKIVIPEYFWFDSIELNIQCDYEDEVSVSLKLVVINGPYPPSFNEMASKIEDELAKAMNAEINQIEDFEGLWESFVISRKVFKQEGGLLTYTISSFDYSYRKFEDKCMLITFSD